MGLIFYLSGLPSLELQGDWVALDFWLRKAAHIVEYAVLFWLWQRALVDKTRHGLTAAVLISMIYAVSDEFHQYLTPTRDGKVIDVLIDGFGITLGYALKQRWAFHKPGVITKSAEKTQELAAEFVKSLKKGGVVALVGDLGSGKTTFVQGIAKALGITQRVTSPTFVLMREYKVKSKNEKLKMQNLVHVDLYRVKGWQDVKNLGLEEIWSDPANLVLIEWAEKINDRLPPETIWVELEYIDENSRRIKVGM